MSSPLAEAFFLWTILTVVMKHPLRDCKSEIARPSSDIRCKRAVVGIDKGKIVTCSLSVACSELDTQCSTALNNGYIRYIGTVDTRTPRGAKCQAHMILTRLKVKIIVGAIDIVHLYGSRLRSIRYGNAACARGIEESIDRHLLTDIGSPGNKYCEYQRQ